LVDDDVIVDLSVSVFVVDNNLDDDDDDDDDDMIRESRT
jgi:hypothetical protein